MYAYAGKKTVYIVFGIICGFRHPLGSWNIYPKDKGISYYIGENFALVPTVLVLTGNGCMNAFGSLSSSENPLGLHKGCICNPEQLLSPWSLSSSVCSASPGLLHP